MITVKTSYFSKVSRGANPNSKLVVISNSYPNWFRGEFVYLKNLSPQWSDVEAYKNGFISYDTLKENYLATLHSRFESTQAIHDYVLEKVGAVDGDEIILLCWEKEKNLCHRIALANEVFKEEYVGEL